MIEWIKDYFEEIAEFLLMISVTVIGALVVTFVVLSFLSFLMPPAVKFETAPLQDSTFKIDVNDPVSVELLDEIMEHQRKINSIVKQLKEREEK